MIARIDANIEKHLTRLDELDTEETPSSGQPNTAPPAQTLRQKIAAITKHHLIVTLEATQDRADHHQLVPKTRQGKASQSAYRVCYTVASCKGCPLLGNCTTGKYRKYVVSHDCEAIEAAAERLRQNPGKIRKRGSLVEHPFGTMKDRLGRDHLVCRGLALVGAELSMRALAYKLTRAIQVLGVSKRLEAIRIWKRGEATLEAAA